MPAFLTHRIIGEKVLKRLNGDTGFDKRAYFLGCQGPDLLYYNWLSPRCGFVLGLQMHIEKTGELLDHAMEFISRYDKPDKNHLISYIAGYLTHIVVDIDMHEFILNSVGNKVRKHHAIEHMWDKYVLDKRSLELGDLKEKLRLLEPGAAISEWYISAAETVYGKKLKAKSLKKACRHYIKRHIFMHVDPDSAGGRIMRFGHMIKQRMVKTAKLDTIFHSDEYYKMSLKLSIKCVNKSFRLIDTMLEYLTDNMKEPGTYSKAIGSLKPYGHDLRAEIKQDLKNLFARSTG